MKRITSFLFLSLIIVLAACNKDEINNTDTRVGISRVTSFPVLSLNGARYMAIVQGGTFTDPGITATVGGSTVAYTTTGSVNTAVKGVYNITYTAMNADGFSASLTRTVVVYSTDASAAGNDLSGTYLRAATGASAVWTKIAPGVYTILNPGGAAGNSLVVIGINPTGYTIDIPLQTLGDGSSFNSTDEVYTPGSPASYVYKLVNPGYGTALRSFVKQ